MNNTTSKAEYAKALFEQGANCAQAVAGAFAAEIGMSETEAFKLASGFGGGVGRLREICGAASGMVLIMNQLYGNSDISDKDAKDAHYARIQSVLKEFERANGSLICRELLGLDKDGETPHTSEARTAGYYQSRPCSMIVAAAAEIMEKYLAR